MKRTRRKFSAAFKAKVVIKALKERQTLANPAAITVLLNTFNLQLR
jgi:transposase-like protein